MFNLNSIINAAKSKKNLGNSIKDANSLSYEVYITSNLFYNYAC